VLDGPLQRASERPILRATRFTTCLWLCFLDREFSEEFSQVEVFSPRTTKACAFGRCAKLFPSAAEDSLGEQGVSLHCEFSFYG